MEELIEKPIGYTHPCQRCGGNGTEELHSCPYACDINDDDTPCCNCCEDCRYECAMDI